MSLLEVSSGSVSRQSSDNDIIEFTAHTDCAICQSQYQEHEKVSMINFCQHYYHKECLTQWFRQKHTCPLCNHSILTTDVKRKIYTICLLNRICKRFDDSHYESALEHIKNAIKNFKINNIKIEISDRDMISRGHLTHIIYQNVDQIQNVFQISNSNDVITHPTINQFYREILNYHDINYLINTYSGTNAYQPLDAQPQSQPTQNVIERSEPEPENGLITTVYKYAITYFNNYIKRNV